MRIIPAIDIIDGKCVRLSKGDYNTKKVYNENPLEVAKEFENSGVKYLHLVDLDGAKSKHIVNYNILESIAANTNLIIDFGGGIKTDKDAEIAFNSGAKQITGGSIAVKDPSVFEGWINKYGVDKLILGADVKEDKIAINGWLEETELTWKTFIGDYNAKGINNVICTDIAKDGMLQGPSIDLYKNMLETFPKLNLIASGGVTTMQDLEKLEEMKMDGAILGKAIYEGRITLKELEQFILNDN